jgi:D-inositol-3-phosphate glycosyltransferase
MRVLTVARWYPSHDSPGRGSFVADLVEATARAGAEVRVVSFDRVLIRGRLEDRAADLVAARAAYEQVATPAALFVTPTSRGAPGVPVARIPLVRRPGSDDVAALIDDHMAALRPFVARLLETWGPDVIHAHTGLPDGIVASEVGRELGIPVVVTEHMSTVEGALADPVALERYRGLLGPGIRLLGVSPSLSGRVAALLGVAAETIGVLPNPVPDGSFPLADPAGRDPDELLWVGSLGEHKGIDVLLRAFGLVHARRQGLRLRLVGTERTAGERRRWEELVATLDVAPAVAFDGWLPRDQVAAAMARAAAFVHPSPSETFGVAAAEAILTGLPVAARRSGGVPWIIELSGGFGRVADGDDAEAFARAIEAVLDEAHELDPSTARSRLVEAIGQRAVGSQALRLYESEVAQALESRSRLTEPAETAGQRETAVPGDDAGPSPLPRVLVATGRDHALPLVAALSSGIRERLVLVVPAWREGATEAPGTPWPVQLIEAASVPTPTPPPRGRGLLTGVQRALHRPAPTGEQLLTDALLAATSGGPNGGGPVEVVAIDAPAAVLVARLADEGVRLAPGALGWLADRWDAEAKTDR